MGICLFGTTRKMVWYAHASKQGIVRTMRSYFDAMVNAAHGPLNHLHVIADGFDEHICRFDISINIMHKSFGRFNVVIDITDDIINVVCNFQVSRGRHQILFFRERVQS